MGKKWQKYSLVGLPHTEKIEKTDSHGGVFILVSDKYLSSEPTDLKSDDWREQLWVKLQVKGAPDLYTYNSWFLSSLHTFSYQGESNELEMVYHRVLMFFTNRQRSTSSVGNMIHHWNWRSLNGRGTDARLVMMYKVANENVAITKHNRLNPPLRKSRNIYGVCCHVCHRAWCQGMCQEMK